MRSNKATGINVNQTVLVIFPKYNHKIEPTACATKVAPNDLANKLFKFKTVTTTGINHKKAYPAAKLPQVCCQNKAIQTKGKINFIILDSQRQYKPAKKLGKPVCASKIADLLLNNKLNNKHNTLPINPPKKPANGAITLMPEKKIRCEPTTKLSLINLDNAANAKVKKIAAYLNFNLFMTFTPIHIFVIANRVIYLVMLRK